MHGFRLDVETHIITAAATSIQNLTKCIRGCGIEIEDLVMEPLASAEAVLTEEEKTDGIILADIGGGTTDIAVFKDNSIYHTAVIPVAGYQITRDISVGLDLSFELAEEMKKKYGNVLPGEGDDKDNDQTLTEDGHSVSYRDLSEIVRVRVEELLRLIVLELPRSDYSKLVPAGLVLTGGSSNLPGMAELAAAVTHLPVRIGVPMNLYGVADSLYDPAYATAVGLVLWKSRKPEVGTETLADQEGHEQLGLPTFQYLQINKLKSIEKEKKMAKTSYVPSGAKIKVVGLGGAGCNAVTRMVREQIRGVEFIAMNTDAQHLAITEAAHTYPVGRADYPLSRCRRRPDQWDEKRLKRASMKSDRQSLEPIWSSLLLVWAAVPAPVQHR